MWSYLCEDLLNRLDFFFVKTSVSHWAGTTSNVFENGHGNLPHVGVWQDWAGLDGAGMWDLVVQTVRPRWGGGGHGGIVVKSVPGKNKKEILQTSASRLSCKFGPFFIRPSHPSSQAVLFFWALRCGGLLSLLSGSVPGIISTLCCRPWRGISYRGVVNWLWRYFYNDNR